MGKFVILTELFILPIVLGRYHGFDSYKQYYDHRNGGELYYTTTTSNTKESFYDGWPRSGDNYASVPRCIKQTFCEDVPDYPQKFVNQMLAKNVSLLQYAYQDVIALSPRLDNEEEPLCLSTERLILPKTAVNMKDQWMYIVQAEDNFRQSLRIEACKEEDAKCRIIDGLLRDISHHASKNIFIASCLLFLQTARSFAISSDFLRAAVVMLNLMPRKKGRE